MNHIQIEMAGKPEPISKDVVNIIKKVDGVATKVDYLMPRVEYTVDLLPTALWSFITMCAVVSVYFFQKWWNGK